MPFNSPLLTPLHSLSTSTALWRQTTFSTLVTDTSEIRQLENELSEPAGASAANAHLVAYTKVNSKVTEYYIKYSHLAAR